MILLFFLNRSLCILTQHIYTPCAYVYSNVVVYLLQLSILLLTSNDNHDSNGLMGHRNASLLFWSQQENSTCTLALSLSSFTSILLLYVYIRRYSSIQGWHAHRRSPNWPELFYYLYARSLRFRIYMEENQPERIYIISHILSLYIYILLYTEY